MHSVSVSQPVIHDFIWESGEFDDIFRQSLVKHQLAKILQVIIPSIFSPFLLTLPTSTLVNFK